MHNLPKVSIIFPNHNGGREPLECLASIMRLAYPRKSIDVIVVDNNSTDGSDAKLTKKYPFIKLIKLKSNMGFAKAINVGITHSSSQYILIANDDILFEKHSVRNLIDYIGKHSDVGIIGGKIFSKTIPRALTSAGNKLNLWTGAVSIPTNTKLASETDWIQGCALLVRKKVLNQIGLLDEDFSHFFEDVDFCMRAKYAKWKVVYLPSARFWHGGSTTANKNVSRKYTSWYQNKIRFILKHLPIINIISILLFQTFLVIPYRTLILHDGRFVPFMKGFFWNCNNLLYTFKLRKDVYKYT